MTWIKICGLLDLETTKAAINCGCDAIGFVFAQKSKRKIDPDIAKQISKQILGKVEIVGVFLNDAINDVNEVFKYCNLDKVQLHGIEDMQYCQNLGLPIIKALQINTENDLKISDKYLNKYVERILLDTYVKNIPGGSGQKFDWTILKNIQKKSYDYILAGGLNSENVHNALKIADPWGLDVSSGVESDGRKDVSKIDAFIANVKKFNSFKS